MELDENNKYDKNAIKILTQDDEMWVLFLKNIN